MISDVHVEHALADGLALSDALALAESADAIVPEQLHRVGENAGYRVAVTWEPNRAPWTRCSSLPPTLSGPGR